MERQNFQAALETLALEQTLTPDPQAEFFQRLAVVFERRADQVEKVLESAKTPGEKASREQQIRSLRIHGGDAYEAVSRKLTLNDDRASGEALWHGVNLYDRAGANQKTADALQRFAADRPDDGQAPEALLRLGRAYQAMGNLDKADRRLFAQSVPLSAKPGRFQIGRAIGAGVYRPGTGDVRQGRESFTGRY